MASPRNSARGARYVGHCGGGLILITLCLGPAPALMAAQTEIVPRVDVGGLHESNPRLSRQTEDEATGVLLDGRLDMTWRTQQTDLYFDPRLRLSFYEDSDDDDLEDDDFWLSTGVEHRTTRSMTALALSYSEVGVRTSELETASDPVTGSTLVDFIDDTQTRWEIEPSWSYQLAPTDLIRLAGGYSDVSYDRNEERSTGRFDYTYLFVDASWEHSFTPRLALGVQLNASEFESENKAAKRNPAGNRGQLSDNDSKTYGGSLFANYALSETLTASAYAGARTTEIETTRVPFLSLNDSPPPLFTESCLPTLIPPLIVPPPCLDEFEGDNFVGQASLVKEGERTRFDFSVSRSISPNSNGAETLRDEFRLTARRDFSERLRGRLGVLYYEQEDAAVQTERDRSYVSIDGNLEWRFTRNLGFRGAYRYVQVEDEFTNATNRDAENHYVYIGLFYRGDGWRWP